jgi:mannose-6-phosphate isomerase-like protein (cupin superfamily)
MRSPLEGVTPSPNGQWRERALLEELSAARGKLAGRATLALLERTTRRGEMPPLHVHREPEAVHVLEGSVLVFVGGASTRLVAGQSLVAPAGVPHTHRAESSGRYVIASFVRSLSGYEGFVRATALPARAHGEEPHEDERVVETLAAENGIAVLGPPGALPVADLAA